MARRRAALLAVLVATAPSAHALTIEEAMAEAVRSNQNVLAARQTARFRHEELPLALSAWRPTVEAAVTAGRTRIESAPVASATEVETPLTDAITRTLHHGSSLPDSTDASVGLRLAVPLYQGGSGGGRLRQARHLRSQLRDQRLAAQRAAVQRATSAWRTLHSARQRYAALDAAVEASRIALAGIRREAEVGERTIREVLDAERSLVLSRVNALDAERDAVVHAHALLEAVGALTARSLGIGGVPDLEREAEEARRNLPPGLTSLRRGRDQAPVVLSRGYAGASP